MSGLHALIIEVRFPGGRFHGARRTERARSSGGGVEITEWPPSPFRLFQALVGGSYGGRWATEDVGPKDAAFAWLESLDAPIVAAPIAHALRPVTYYVPNNDLDTVEGDPKRVNEIRVPKRLQGAVLNPDEPVIYAWTFVAQTAHAELLCAITERLHTLGRGVDAAFAAASVVDEAQLQQRLDAHGSVVRRPGAVNDAADGAPCPAPGSLASLKRRHDGLRQRFRQVMDGRKSVIEFRQPPHAQMRMVGYGMAPSRMVFELRDSLRTAEFRPAPHTGAAALVKVVRDLAFDRLAAELPERRAALERAIVGRGEPSPDPLTRVRFIPLPSIGLEHTSPSIRRLLIEMPSGAPLTRAELSWALAGRVFGGQADADGALSGQTLLTPTGTSATDDPMAARYLRKSTLWRSVTPVVLPHLSHAAAAADGSEHRRWLQLAAHATTQALRHAQIDAQAVSVRLQSEPFHRRGRLSADHDGDRFGSVRLHHLELRLDRAVQGPLVLGDGRWIGLGLMEPVTESPPEVHVFRIDGKALQMARAFDVARALRRAVMARVQAVLGDQRPLPLFFSGHEDDRRPAAGEHHQHLFYLADDEDGDGRIDRLAIVVPRAPPASTSDQQRQRLRYIETLERALRALRELRAGPCGVLGLRIADVDARDMVFGAGRTWISRTPYRPTRQPKRNIDEALRDDLRRECARRCLPAPQEVEILGTAEGARGRLSAQVRLRFATAVIGPLLLGDSAHFGQSLFHHDGKQGPDAAIGTALAP